MWWPKNPLIGAAGRFIVIFGLLVLPWPGWNAAYSGYFRALGQAVFGHQDEQRIVRFVPYHEQHGFSSLDTQMTLGNRALADSTGKGKAESVTLDTRSIGWVPTALTMALILATPVPWRQRAWALLWGLLLIHAFILFSLQTWIWYASPDLSLLTLSPFTKSIVDGLEYTLLTQLGASFSVPMLIWILVTIRRENLFSFSPPQAQSKSKPSQAR
ncbi:MAG: hypothetical protein LV480_10865 [Methylacidiphilales bacterium]|nr:hypothetical protein [Candidatus Methylacidiphilales bacterium]